MAELADDPDVRSIRAAIDAADRAILEALGHRLSLVAELKELKEARGYAFVDPGREERLLQSLVDANAGPLSADGVREIFRLIVARTKRDVYGT